MRIGICGPINPYELRDYLFSNQEIHAINKGATAVNTFVKELLRQGLEVVVFTSAVPSNVNKDYMLKGEKIDIHVVHSTPGVYITHSLSRIYMIRRLRDYMRPYIAKLDVLHAQWTYDFALAAKTFEGEIPVFCTVRDWCPYIMSIQKGLKKWQWYLYSIIFKRVMSSKKIHFIANSKYTYNQIKSTYPQKKINIIYNPIDKRYILNKKLKDVDGIIFISISSSLTEKRKNIKRLLEAFQIFRKENADAQLKLIGGGLEDETSLYLEYKRLGLLENVSILGQLQHAQLIDEIDNSTCLIHPSLEETFGNILIEGMSRCLPVIGGQKSGAVPQVLENGSCGILCDVQDVNSIAYAMEQSTNRELVDNLVAKATMVLYKKYSSDSIVNQHISLYKPFLQ